MKNVSAKYQLKSELASIFDLKEFSVLNRCVKPVKNTLQNKQNNMFVHKKMKQILQKCSFKLNLGEK